MSLMTPVAGRAAAASILAASSESGGAAIPRRSHPCDSRARCRSSKRGCPSTTASVSNTPAAAGGALSVAIAAQYAQQTARFRARLLKFARRVRIGDDPGAGAKRQLVPGERRGADEYVEIEAAVETEVAERAGIGAARLSFERREIG